MVRGSWTHETEGLGFRARIILILAAIVALSTCRCFFFYFGVHAPWCTICTFEFRPTSLLLHAVELLLAAKAF